MIRIIVSIQVIRKAMYNYKAPVRSYKDHAARDQPHIDE